MSNVDNIEVKRFMAERLGEGESLSTVQQEVNEKFGLKLTFMDVRIMASELENIDWSVHDPKPPEPADENGTDENPLEPEPVGGGTVVEVSKLVRPGTALSGNVTFKSGSRAEWYVDSYGRLGLENLQGAEPTEEDVREFQQELQKALGR